MEHSSADGGITVEAAQDVSPPRPFANRCGGAGATPAQRNQQSAAEAPAAGPSQARGNPEHVRPPAGKCVGGDSALRMGTGGAW